MTAIDLKPLVNTFKTSPVRRYTSGQILIQPGDKPQNLFLLRSGTVRKYFVTPDGYERTVILYRLGDIFPWSVLLDQFPNNFYYEAITPVQTHARSYLYIQTVLKNNPTASFNLFLDRISISFHDRLRLDLATTGNAYIKTVLTIIYMAEVMGITKEDASIINPRISQEKIASIAGLSRERINIAMEKMKFKKLITYTNKELVVLSIKKLKEELE